MQKIHQLSQDVINKISAGEVVERPSSVIKELVENSIDAKSTHITIFIQNGGIDLIKIQDNGTGISKQDIPLLLHRHATSKINKFEDLNSIQSYGFRGEALSAIASVAKFELTTKTDKEKIGTKLEKQNKDIKISPISRGTGTTITIQELFYNVPARRKFLKSPTTEYKHVLFMLENFALTYPQVRFTLYKDNKEVFDLLPTESFIDRIAQVIGYGKEDLVFYEDKTDLFGISVVLLHPKLLSERSRFLRIFVNNRYVEDKALVSAIKQGIIDYIPHSYRPSALLFLKIPASYVDVNVHPRKIEVKFANPYRVYAFVKSHVKRAISSKVNQDMRISQFAGDTNITNSFVDRNQTNAQLGDNMRNYNTVAQRHDATTQDLFDQEKGYSRLRSKTNSQQGFENTVYSNNKNFGPLDSLQKNKLHGNLSGNYENADFATRNNTLNTPSGTDLYHEISSVVDTQNIKNIMQLLNRYVLVEWESEIWLIDQHAAAERIRYEQLLRSISNARSQDLQTLILGPTIVLSASDMQVLQEKQDILNKLGFEFKIKGKSIQITAIPVFAKEGQIERIFRDVLSQISELDLDNLQVYDIKFVTDNKFSKVVATIACHSSIRAKEKMNNLELKHMIDQLLACDVPYACPHGRRLLWRLTSEDIDKQFMR